MGISERRQREKEQRRNTILNAAENIFFTRGIQQATMDEVAENAELSKGTLYLYFNSKEELYLAIVCRALNLLRDMFRQAVDKNTSGIEKVRAIGEAYYQYSHLYPDYFHMIVQFEAFQMEKTDEEEILLQCHQQGRQVMEIVREAVSAGVHDGTIRPDLNPVRTAYLLQGLSTGIIQLIAREKEHIEKFEEFQSADLMEDFMDMMFHALHKTNS